MCNCKPILMQARRMPAETCFLSVNTHDANVKVRDGLLDIKVKGGETPTARSPCCQALPSSADPKTVDRDNHKQPEFCCPFCCQRAE